MSEEIRLITTKRDHLFDISQTLCAAIPLEFMQDKNNPVIISVRGSMNDGKKIFPDAAVEKLLGVPDAQKTDQYTGGKQKALPFFEGKPEYDEYWTGQYQNTELQITFINAAWSGNYSNIVDNKITPNGHFSENIAKIFIPLRQKGGVTFVHNSDNMAENEAWIDIWMEKKWGSIVGRDLSHLENEEKHLKDDFNAIASKEGNEGWTRYIHIVVHKDELLQSSKFINALEQLNRPHCIFAKEEGEFIASLAEKQAVLTKIENLKKTPFYYM